MEFDDYLTGPVGQKELLTAVRGLVQRIDHDPILRGYFAHRTKILLLEAEKPRHQLARHAAYDTLRERFEAVKHDARAIVNESVDLDDVTDILTGWKGDPRGSGSRGRGRGLPAIGFGWWDRD